MTAEPKHAERLGQRARNIGHVADAKRDRVGVETAVGERQRLCIAFDQLDPPEVADSVGDPRAHQVAEHADRCDREQRKAALGDGEAREQHRCLRWDWDARALGQHQHEDPAQPKRTDGIRGEVD